MSASGMLIISFLLLAAVLLLQAGRRVSRRWSLLLFIPLSVQLVLLLFYLVADSFTGSGIDRSVIYHLRSGLHEAGFAEYATLITATALALAGWLVLYALLLRRTAAAASAPARKSRALPVLLLALGGLGSNPAIHDLGSLWAAGGGSDSQFFRNHIVPPAAVASSAGDRSLNILYIYAESLEQTYFDEQIFPGLLPGLKKLQDEAIAFTDVSQVDGTGWTIGGMVGSQCGIPLFTPSDGNALDGMKEFLGEAICMGDLLRQAGYRLDYMGGASTHFAGKGNFYRSHGFSNISGHENLLELLPDPGYRNAWGLYDDSLLELARRRLAELHDAGQPFGLFLLTLDTHHPAGHLSASCAGLRYPHADNAMLDAVHCTDRLLSRFIGQLREDGLIDNTLVVLASDHLAMRNLAHDQLRQGQRKNLFMLLPPTDAAGQRIARPASILDTGVTALAAMGFDIDALGYGRNLLNYEQPTLAERHDDLSARISGTEKQLARLWGYQSLRDGIRFDVQRRELRIGERRFGYPVLFLLDKKNSVEKILFESGGTVTLPELLADEPAGRKYFWVDSCVRLSAMVLRTEPYEEADCALAGVLGGEAGRIWFVKNDEQLEHKNIHQVLKDGKDAAPEPYQQQLARLQDVARFGVGIDAVHAVSADFPHPAVLGISLPSPENPFSAVHWDDAGSMRSMPVEGRGLHVFGLDAGGSPQPLTLVDGCEPDAGRPDGRLGDTLGAAAGYGYFLLLVHDTLHCGDDRLIGDYLAGSRLERLPEAGFRQPYIALLDAGGRPLFEETRPAGHPLAISFVRAEPP